MKKINKLYSSDFGIGGLAGPGEEELYNALALQQGKDMADRAWFDIMTAFVPALLGIAYNSTGQVDYLSATQLLYMVNRDVYGAVDFELTEWYKENGSQNALKMAGDDFLVYRDSDGVPVLYRHFYHGDLGDVWFTVSEE